MFVVVYKFLFCFRTKTSGEGYWDYHSWQRSEFVPRHLFVLNQAICIADNTKKRHLNANVSKVQKYKYVVMIIGQKEECDKLKQEYYRSLEKICVKLQHGAKT